jgi:predicted RNA binding protein YcfA (HicA-like mRNA interferase family)
MPPHRPTRELLPEPHDLLRALARHGAVDWGESLPTAAEIARMYGDQATARSLELLEQLVATEPRVTAEFLSAVPSLGSPYQLAHRIKSPQSLARKLFDRQDQRRWWRAPEDLLRYTVRTESPDKLVTAARHTAGELNRTGWQVTYAMQSYTAGSRYKGIHAFLKTSTAAKVEVQFHSAQSIKVKELTTPYYEVERSAQATIKEREAARRECIHLSATLTVPTGIDQLKDLGGRAVEVKNYSDSRQTASPSAVESPRQDGQSAVRTAAVTREDGVGR